MEISISASDVKKALAATRAADFDTHMRLRSSMAMARKAATVWYMDVSPDVYFALEGAELNVFPVEETKKQNAPVDNKTLSPLDFFHMVAHFAGCPLDELSRLTLIKSLREFDPELAAECLPGAPGSAIDRHTQKQLLNRIEELGLEGVVVPIGEDPESKFEDGKFHVKCWVTL